MKRDPSYGSKTILFVNSGGKKKRFTLDVAKKLGLQTILVNQQLDVPKRSCDFFIQADTYNAREVIDKIEVFLEENPEITLDGAITFWEDDIPVLARVCEHFRLPGNSYDTAINTRNKYEMRKRLRETGLGSPGYFLLTQPEDVESAIDEIGFPAVMKPVWGADSEFVVLVREPQEAFDTYEYLIKNCTEQFNPIFKYNGGLFLYEEYLEGTEVSLECYSQYGIPQVLAINEKQPIKPPYFVEYGDICPARLTEETERDVVKLGESSLIALGVKNSLAHIELKITPQGPKLIEVASRMGGDDIYLNVKTVWDQDMVKMGIQIALGEKVDYRKGEALERVVCRYFIPNYSGIVTTISGVRECKKMRNVLDLVVSKDVGDPVFVPPEGFENMGWVITKGSSYQEAEAEMERVFKELEIGVTPFHKQSSLGKTTRKDALSSASLIRSQIIRAAKIEKIRAIELDKLKKLHIGVLSNSQLPLIDESFRENRLGKEIADVLSGLGYKVSLFDMNETPLPIKKLQSANLDFVFNLCEAIHNSTLLESHAAALLDMLQLPYTGSGPATMSQCIDKITVKKLFDYHEIPTPNWDYIYSMSDELRSDLNYPLIVKPANTDNSYGITNQSVVTDRESLMRQLDKIVNVYNRPALIEEYIEGDEYDVCLIGNGDEVRILPLIRSIFDGMPKDYWHIYGWESKGDFKHTAYDQISIEKPARISRKLAQLMSEIALDVYNLFNCNDYGKVEFRVDRDGNPYVLEVNPNPPISTDDFFTMSVELDGYSYAEFLEQLLLASVQRYKASKPAHVLTHFEAA